jgi:membrane protein DedA with SNARE-associated domain
MYSIMLSDQNWLTKLGIWVSAQIAGLGGLGIMILAIGDSSFLSIPEGNDLLIVILSAGKSWGRMAYYVGMTIAGSVTGCLLLYTIGRQGGNPMLRRKFSPQTITRAETLFKKYGLLAVFIPSILPPPMPFKMFVLSAGVFRLRTRDFLLAVLIGRTIRYSVWGILAVLYGNSIKLYMQQNLKVIGLMLCGGFILIAAVTFIYYLRKTRASRSGKAG